ncbi:hypothetical protein AVEN_146158-1 [Araneus ventricosus]|uniref:Uncharacterized protein n=1 Tax=Araneus ventricosus TaxID=182803 RepID=A0A4Y2EJ74_ARAVE|nr:hypothetical protein AVEN_146158-1 [Araneus ventricosus]
MTSRWAVLRDHARNLGQAPSRLRIKWAPGTPSYSLDVIISRSDSSNPPETCAAHMCGGTQENWSLCSKGVGGLRRIAGDEFVSVRRTITHVK